MASSVKRAATYADVLEAPDNVVAEIIGGDLYTSPRPASRHALATTVLGGELLPPFQHGRGGPGGRWIVFEPELHLAEDILVPDLAGWRRTRLPAFPDAPYFTLAPDWICETLSQSTERIDRLRKLAVYARESVGHAWLVSPALRTVEVYRLDNGRWVLLNTHGEDQMMRAEPFDAIEIDLLRLWGESRG
jgi:Uma2 family endonuclease